MARTFGFTHWGITLIENGKAYASLYFPAGPGGPAHYLERPHIVKIAEAWASSTLPAALGMAIAESKKVVKVGWHSAADGKIMQVQELGGAGCKQPLAANGPVAPDESPEPDYGGVLAADGQVYSDADPGL